MGDRAEDQDQPSDQGSSPAPGGTVHSATEHGTVASHPERATQPFLVGPTTTSEHNTLGLDLVPVACLSLHDILFEFDSSFPLPTVALMLKELPGLREQHKGPTGLLPPVSIFGHADPVGGHIYNKPLSGRRARAIYGAITHDLNVWQQLHNEEWHSQKVAKTMQDATGKPDGTALKDLMQAYMNVLFANKLEKSDFLGKGGDPHGKADLQGCSDFNLLVLLSTTENTNLTHEQRNSENQPNRRVVVFLFRPGLTIHPSLWPCPTTVDPAITACRKRFFGPPQTGDIRITPGPDRREFAKTSDTFACRFYDRVARLSPCEKPGPPVQPGVSPLIAFTIVVPTPPEAAVQSEGARSAAASAAAPVGAPVTPAKPVVVVKKPHTNPDRVAVLLKTDTPFDGTGVFTRSNNDIRFFTDGFPATQITFNGKDNKFTGAELTAGVTVLAEGASASQKVGAVTLTLTLSGGSKKIGLPATAKMTAIDVTLGICKRRTSTTADPPELSSTAKVNPGRTVHVQDAANSHQRAMLIVHQVRPKDFAGKLLLRPNTTNLQIFQNETPAAGEAPMATASNAFSITHDGSFPAAGQKFFAEGATVSGAFQDTGVTLGVDGVEVDADHVVCTVVKAQLDIGESRTAAGTDPNLLSDADKINVGRFVHVQDPGHHQGRAMLLIQQVQPADWVGQLTLAPIETSNPKVRAFQQEVPAAGQSPIANPAAITHDSKFPAAGLQRFAEGASVSGALRDTGFKLGIQDVEDQCDHVVMTVVRLHNLTADVPSTPANTNRLGNSPVARHTLTRAPGGLAAADYDEEFTTNPPLVLVEDSIVLTDLINLSVTVDPAGVPVNWSIQRDTRAAPKGDHADIIALSPNPLPTLSPDAGNPLRATLQANAVGSFHIRPFVDCNGNSTFEGDDASNNRIDREPFIIMNLVLVRIQGFTNASVAQQANARLIPAAPTSATGVQVSTGNFANAAGAGVHNDATIEVIGGSADGLRGLDKLFAGWVNNELASAGSPTAPPTEDNVADYLDPTPPNATHPRFTAWVQPPAHGLFQTFRPAPPHPPFTIQAGPVLDTTNFGNEGTGGNRCIGTEGAVGPPLAIVKTARPRPAGGGNLGQRWRIQMFDSPGDSAPRRHEGFPAARMIDYRFNIDFRSDLVFWTNIKGTPAPTPDAACRLYSTVMSNGWTIRCSITFNAAGVATINTPLTIAMTQDPNPTKRATPVDGSGVEVRAPISLRLLIVDATT